MAGLALGSLLGSIIGGFISKTRHAWIALVSAQCAYVLFPLFLIGILGFLYRSSPDASLLEKTEFFFPLLNCIGGVIGGFHFVFSSRILEDMGRASHFAGGWVYGLDLFGAATGVFFASVFFIPVLGLTTGAAIVSLTNFIAAIVGAIYLMRS